MNQKIVASVWMTAISAALALGLASGANAQEVTLPAVHTQGGVAFVSGGIGHDEALAMRRDETRWPLSLGFFGATGDYLADVHVRIVNADGQQVLHSESQGPYMLVKLAPGAYTVHATYDGKKEVRKVVVEGNGHATTNFRFANA